MTPEDIKNNARLKIALWGFLGVLCTIMAAPYMMASSIMSFANLKIEDADEMLESDSLGKCAVGYIYLSSLAILYCIITPVTLALVIPGYFFEIGAQEMLLGYRDNEGADISWVQRAFFELEEGMKYISNNQVAMMKQGQKMQMKESPPEAEVEAKVEDVDTNVLAWKVSEVCVNDKKKEDNELKKYI